MTGRTGGPLLALVGATGTGKTRLAVALAEHFGGGEVISCDSGQIYRGLDVGTAKPTPEERRRAPHHLIDILDPEERWSAAEFAEAADAAIAAVRDRGHLPIVVGGNGLWYRALVKGIFAAPSIPDSVREQVRDEIAERGSEVLHAELRHIDPVAAARIQPRDPQRIARALEVIRHTGIPISRLQDAHGFAERRYEVSAFALDWPREILREHLGQRVRRMFEDGLLEEVDACLARGLGPDAPGLGIIGYKEATAYRLGRTDLDEAVEKATTATRRYAKRQRNWFRHEPEVQWIPPAATVHEVVERLPAGWAEV
ncbi:MAG: tRNA (adenosine(37)-N6)-dimethylallyltransferase MiaA [Myxococcota bacterium]